MWVGEIETDVRAAEQTVALIRALGGKAEWPSFEGRLKALDEYLVSAPKPVDTEDAELRAALGLRGPGG